ncbi:hypothetical protein F383_23992 [Gossypium arboreum]|uniref:Uncharacterized protein n=1 Tax=Gossypium arboreum TaxID=29729 RepID=A0A0B0PBI3_GOSAR|nr:hypothetical protein F383_23992 [Gossypium arboreum]
MHYRTRWSEICGAISGDGTGVDSGFLESRRNSGLLERRALKGARRLEWLEASRTPLRL